MTCSKSRKTFSIQAHDQTHHLNVSYFGKDQDSFNIDMLSQKKNYQREPFCTYRLFRVSYSIEFLCAIN
jgi:hypothetical protein